VLRIGVIHDDMLVAEGYFRPGEANPIVVGNEPGTHIHTPWATGIHRLPLFQHKGGQWQLRVGGDLAGVLLKGGRTHDVAAIRAAALAKGASPRNDIVIPLTESTSGRLRFRDTRLLFQFAHPPRPPALVPLGRRLVRVARRLDWIFVNLLLAMFIFQGLGMVVLQVNYQPPPDDPGFLGVPNVKVFVPEKPPEVTRRDEPEEAEKGPAEKAAPPPEPEKQDRPSPDQPPDATERKAQIQQKLNKQTIIRYLAAVTEGDNNNIVSNDQVGARLAAAWDGTPGVIGDEGETRSGARYVDKGGLIGKTASLTDADLGDTGTAVVDSGKAAEVKVRGRISAAAAEEVFGSGALEKSAISGVVQRRLGAIKACYERELKGNPTLGGKVIVQFTIQESGRVADVKIVSDSTQEPRIGKCIANQIAHFKFPQPEGGSVTASYPFVLQAGT